MGVTLQINVAPGDHPHAAHILPYQLRVWAGQVDEVLFSYDLTPPAAGRFGLAWAERRPAMDDLLARLCAEHAHARVAVVDTSPAAIAAVAARFVDQPALPLKDSRGGPMYAYFFGLHDATHDLVLHCDSDMLFGGGSQRWVTEARALLDSRPAVLFAGPLPGPPAADGTLVDQPGAVREPGGRPSYRFATVSTRVFLVDRRTLAKRASPLTLRPPLLLRSRLKAKVRRHPAVAMFEQILSAAMRERDLMRVDLLGGEPGMWSLHPPYRSETF